MGSRDPFAPHSGRDYGGSVERVQDPYGAIQEASRSPRDAIKGWIMGLFGGDEDTSLNTGLRDEINEKIVDVAGPVRNPTGITEGTATSQGYFQPGLTELSNQVKSSFFGDILPTYLQTTQLQGGALAPPVPPLGELAYWQRPRPEVFDTDLGALGQGVGFSLDGDEEDGTQRTSARTPKGGRRNLRDAIQSLTDEQKIGGDLISSAMARYQAEQYAAWEDSIKGLSDQYKDRIGELKDELAGYKGGLAGVNTAYSEYADDADAILKEAASVTQEALPESEAPEQVAATYDEYEGQVGELLNKIDANGNNALAQEMSEQMTYLEDVITDGLRSKIASQANLHELAGAQAQALANMAWKDDLYNAEKARFQTELQIQAQIKGKQNQIDKAQKEMDRAIAEARAQYQEEMPSPEQLWDYALSDYFKEYGINDAQAIELRNMWDAIGKNNPQAFENYDTFKSEVLFNVNQTNLMRAGLWDDYENGLNRMTEEGALAAKQMLGTIDVTNLSGMSGQQKAVFNLFFPDDSLQKLADLENKVSLSDPAHTSVLDLWSHWKGFIENYNPVPFVPPQSGSQAPNNVQNQNLPEYKYRREVAVPYFANHLSQRFPGVEFGGVHFDGDGHVHKGMIRNPESVGGGKASNSDHLSGGALDIYFKSGTEAQTNQKLSEIAAYLRMQPWASLVVYEGNKAHQTGTNNAHVHLSLPVGYQV